MDEKQFLDSVADTYDIGSASDNWRRESYLLVYKNYLKQKHNIMEMGCADGYTAIRLSEMVAHVDVMDGSSKMLAMLSEKIREHSIDNIDTIYSLFEDMDYEERYDAICCSYVLEHVQNPVEILKKARVALKSDGKMMITVPNATALSRQMAKCMGLIDDLYALTQNDLNHGHRRVYDMSSMKNDAVSAGFEIIDAGGTFVKQFADFQLDQMMEHGILGESQIFGMRELAKEFPEISGSIYLILQK